MLFISIQVKRDGSNEVFVLGHGTDEKEIVSRIEDEFKVQWNSNMNPKEYAILNTTRSEDRLVRNEAAQKVLSLKKDVDGIIESNSSLFSSLQEVERVYIYGLSFGDVDLKYLDKIISSIKPDSNFTINYFSDRDKVKIDNFAHSRNIKYNPIRLSNLCICPLVRLYLNVKRQICEWKEEHQGKMRAKKIHRSVYV